MAWKFYTNLVKRLQLNARKFWGLIPSLVAVPGEKLVGGGGGGGVMGGSFCLHPELG